MTVPQGMGGLGSYDFVTHQDEAAQAIFPVVGYVTGDTLVAQFDQNLLVPNLITAGNVTVTGTTATLTLSSAEVNNIKDAKFTIIAAGTKTIAQGKVIYVPTPNKALEQQIDDDLARVAITGDYNDLLNKPSVTDTSHFAPVPGTIIRPSGGDDTTQVLNALTAGDLYLASGSYNIGFVSYEGSGSRNITALGPVTLVQTNATGMFDLRGAWEALGTVSSYATVTSDLVTPGESNPLSSRTDVTVLTMAAPVTVNVGDIVKIVADDQVPTARDSTSRVGEYAMVAVASTGTTVTLSRRLVENYVTNIRLVRLSPTKFTINGPISFDTDPGIRNTTIWGAALLLRAAQNCYVGGGVEFNNSLGRAIGNFTYGAHFDSIKFKNLANRPTLSQYGYGVQDGGWATRMSGCYGENLRHLYTTGDISISAGDPTYEYYGGGWFGVVSNCVGVNNQAQTFDTHGDGYGITFVGCKVEGSFQGASSGGFGISVRGRNHHIVSCTVNNSWTGIGVTAAGTLVENCMVTRSRYTALSIGGDQNDAISVTSIGGIRVSGGSYESTTANATAIIGTTGYTLDVELSGVRFRQTTPPSGGRFIQAAGALTLHTRNIEFDLTQVTTATSLSGFYLTGSSVITLRGSGLDIRGGSGAYTGISWFQNDGTAGTSAVVRYDGIKYYHNSITPVTIAGSWNDIKISYVWSINTTNWWQKDQSSRNYNVTSSASLTLTALGQTLDQDVTYYLNGSNGAVTISSLPLAVQGTKLTIFNASNGDVTIPGLNTVTAGTGKSYVFSNNLWKTL